MTLEVIGWVGSFLFMFCGLPQVWACYKQGHGEGLSWIFLLMWLGGEVCTLIYVWPKGHLPLLTNYVLNILLLLGYNIL